MLLNSLMSMDTQFIRKKIHSLMGWILPRSCALCGDLTPNVHSFCNACQRNLPILPQRCQQCAQFLRLPAINPLKCGSCLSHPPDFDLTYTLFPYEFPIDSLIKKLKFQQKLSSASALGHLMRESIQTDWYRHHPLPDLIIPVPLHPWRLIERGFNQALEIAKPIARSLPIPIDYHGIKRIKPTLAQSGLSATARKHNITKAFLVEKNYQGLTLALLDDVMTTGTTIRECARLLKKSGAKCIHVWCCARSG